MADKPTTAPGMDRISVCHWTPGADLDADLISNSQTCRDFSIAWAAWYVLTREASYRRSLVFILTADLLAKRMVTSPTTALKACRVLEGLGLLTSNTHRIAGTKFKTACERTIHPAVLPWKEARSPETNDRSPETNDRCVTREASEVAGHLQNPSKVLGGRESWESSPAATPEARRATFPPSKTQPPPPPPAPPKAPTPPDENNMAGTHTSTQGRKLPPWLARFQEPPGD